jgi:hypothetical protein
VRASHPLPLSPSMGTCDGQPGSFSEPVETAISKLKFQRSRRALLNKLLRE